MYVFKQETGQGGCKHAKARLAAVGNHLHQVMHEAATNKLERAITSGILCLVPEKVD